MIKKVYLYAVIISLFYGGQTFAYLGLGPLIPVVGSAVAFIFTIGLIGFGALLYPIKQLIYKIRGEKVTVENEDNNEASQ